MITDTIKIAKFLSQTGIASRRLAETLVKQGLISVNGKRMDNVAQRINPQTDRVGYNGKILKLPQTAYYLLYKPIGYVSTVKDPHAQKLITDLVPKIPKVWPVGRLDKFSSGLILLTNDGELTQKITHPRYQIEKEYEIATNFALSPNDLAIIKNGIHLEDGFVKPDLFEQINPGHYRIIIHSGKKRVVRRLIEKIGKKVAELKRTRIAFLNLKNLSAGIYRNLSLKEISQIKSLPSMKK